MQTRRHVEHGVLLRAFAAVLVALMALATFGTGAAEARSSSHYRETGRAATTYWTQVDGTEPGTSPFGNVHIGYLSAYETTRGLATAWGSIEDWDCPAGELPWGGHHGFEEPDEPPAGNCEWKGFRWLEGDNLEFSMDRKMSTATLRGPLVAYGGGHGDEGVVGYPMADIVWTGSGGTYTSRYTSRYRDGNTTWTETYRSTERSAVMGGTLGPMGFDPDLSGGFMSTYSTSSKSRTK